MQITETLRAQLGKMFRFFTGKGFTRTLRRVTERDIFELIEAYEQDSDTFFEFWSREVGGNQLSHDQKAYLRRHFPRGNFLRRMIQRMAHSMPSFSVSFKTPTGDDLPDEDAENWDNWLKSKFNARGWEGDANFWAALGYWREMVFLTGRLTIKLIREDPVEDDVADDKSTGTGRVDNPDEEQRPFVCIPQRMSQHGQDWMVSDMDRKAIVAWAFNYSVGGGSNGSGERVIQVTEKINKDYWEVISTGSEAGEAWPIPPELGFIPVSYLGWERIEQEPLGLPLGRRIRQKLLNVLSILSDIRVANRNNSQPIKAVINADLPAGIRLVAGSTVAITSKMAGQNADIKSIGGNLEIKSHFDELEVAMRDLYEDAHLPYPGKEDTKMLPDASGKAIELLSAPQIAYREQYCLAEAGFLQDMIYKMARIEGKQLKMEQVVITHDPIMPESSTAKEQDSRFFSDNGFMNEALRRRGIPDEEIPRLLKERDEFMASRAKSFLLGAAGIPNFGQPEGARDMLAPGAAAAPELGVDNKPVPPGTGIEGPPKPNPDALNNTNATPVPAKGAKPTPKGK